MKQTGSINRNKHETDSNKHEIQLIAINIENRQFQLIAIK